MSVHSETKQEIEKILNSAFAPLSLNVVDDSSTHRNHAEAKLRPTAGHFKVIMKSAQFDGLNQVKRHRMVYEKLAGLMDKKIHALSLELSASDE